MNYQKYKKHELIDMLHNQKHLAKAVESKDKEIHDLREQVKHLHANKAQSLSDYKKSQEKTKVEMQYQIEDLKAQLKDVPDATKIKERLNFLEAQNQQMRQFINQYVTFNRNHLKQQQASLDTAIELEGLIFEKIENKKGDE